MTPGAALRAPPCPLNLPWFCGQIGVQESLGAPEAPPRSEGSCTFPPFVMSTPMAHFFLSFFCVQSPSLL